MSTTDRGDSDDGDDDDATTAMGGRGAQRPVHGRSHGAPMGRNKTVVRTRMCGAARAQGAAGVGKGPMLPEREGPASPPKAPVSTQLDRVGSEGRGFEPHVGCNRTVAQSGPSTGLARLAQLVEHQTLTDDFFARRRGGTPRFCAAALCSVRMGGNVCVDCPPRGSAAWPRPHRSRSPMSTFTVTHKRTDRGGGTVLDWAERTRKACADSLRVLQSTRLVTFPPVADKYRSWKDGGGQGEFQEPDPCLPG